MTKEEMASALTGHAIYKDYGREGACYAGHVQEADIRGSLVFLVVKIGHDRIGEVLRRDDVERLLDGQFVTMDKDERITIRL